MIFIQTPLTGVMKIDLEKISDNRGFFARYFCEKQYKEQGLTHHVVQMNNSYSRNKGTLRGIHYQAHPMGEDKIIRCLSGALFDVVVDLRIGSPTFLKWVGEELTAENRTMLYVPKGFGHAFLTLADDTEVLYLVTEFYTPGHEHGIRWDDMLIGVNWPQEPQFISEKDAAWPDFNPKAAAGHLYRYQEAFEK